MKGCGQAHTEQPESQVGIFWLVGKHLVVDTTPLSEARQSASAFPPSIQPIREFREEAAA